MKFLVVTFFLQIFFLQICIDPASAMSSFMESRCIEPDAELGHRMVAHCEVQGLLESGSDQTYKMNSLGLYDLEVPDWVEGEFRILLMGRELDGFGIPPNRTPSAQLRSLLNQMGLKQIRVINGSHSGFGISRNTVWLQKNLERLRPDIVIYNLAADHVIADYVEDQLMERDAESVVVRYSGVSAVDLQKRPLFSSLKLMFDEALILWSVYQKTESQMDLRKRITGLIWKEMAQLSSVLGPMTPVVISWAPRAGRGYSPKELSFLSKALFRTLTPEIKILGGPMTRQILEQGYPYFLLPQIFKNPISKNLISKQNEGALTESGAQVWAESTAFQLLEHVQFLKQENSFRAEMHDALRIKIQDLEKRWVLDRAKSQSKPQAN